MFVVHATKLWPSDWLLGFNPQICFICNQESSGIGIREGNALSVSPDGGSYKISALSILSSSGFVIASSCKDITVLATKHHGIDSAVQSIRSSDARTLSAQRGTEPILRQMPFLLEVLQHVFWR